MEKNIDRKVLSFSKGMTNTPSDLLCEDSELAECDGFIYRDGEMKPIQSPKEIGNIPYKIMYVHKQADYENIIAYDENKTIYWYKKDTDGTISDEQGSFDIGATTDIQSVGNTLVCATSEGLHYLLFKGSAYKDLGTELPKPKVEFYTNGTTTGWQSKQDDLKKDSFVCNLEGFVDITNRYAFYNINSDHKLFDTDANQKKHDSIYARLYFHHSVKSDKDTDFKDAIVGHVEQMRNWVKEKNKFAYPFFVRFALKLFDGSYARISNPIICYPSVSKNCKFITMKKASNGYYEASETGSYIYLYNIGYSGLFFKATINGIDGWSDIVKELTVFATDDVCPFELNGDWNFKDPMDVDNTVYYNRSGSYHEDVIEFMDSTYGGGGYHPCATEWLMPIYKTEAKIIKELLNKTQFYKLFSLEIDSSYIDGQWHDSSYDDESTSDITIIQDSVVSNLTEQEQLSVDDYYGWTSLVPDKTFTYNSRINLFKIKRYPFSGFNFFTECSNNNSSSKYEYYTHIVNSQMDTWVKSSANNNIDTKFLSGWLYYPDTNATEMLIMKSGENRGIRISLIQHKMLNGAYSFLNLPNNIEATFSTMEAPAVDTDAYEILNSNIYTSAVNNPFVFEASGDNTVGTGKILGIIANTEAVSQGQFGQYPLMVFTDEGIYGMSVNSEGLYSATYPISREVYLDNSPLVPTDKLVYFVSKKGLMAASGGSVGCMSDMLRGRAPRNFATVGDGKFLEFLKDCKIAYDYRDSLLRIFSKDKVYQYIYNMIDKTFSMVYSGIEAKAIVNDYPDNLIQDTSGNVYSLTGKSDINDDENTYKGSFVTRPLKLGGSMNLKSLRAIKHLVDTDNGNIALEIYGSNDCKHWQKLISLGGKPYKYFTFVYHLEDLKATDAFSGSIVEIQTRRQDKIR